MEFNADLPDVHTLIDPTQMGIPPRHKRALLPKPLPRIGPQPLRVGLPSYVRRRFAAGKEPSMNDVLDGNERHHSGYDSDARVISFMGSLGSA